MPRKGSIAMELLLMLITIVITSAIIFTLVRADVIHVKPQTEEVSLLDTEFLPYPADNVLVVKDFQFCTAVAEDYSCQNPTTSFQKPSTVFFRFLAESSSVNGQVSYLENYLVKDPSGKVVLDVRDKALQFEQNTSESTAKTYFKDYLLLENTDPVGKYTLEIVLENPLLGKKVTVAKEFEVK